MTRSASPTPLLSRGDVVGVVSTGFAVKREPLQAGLDALTRMGFRPTLGPNALARDGYLAGNDDARASDLAVMLDDPDVAAVWFARGGYGTARILDRVPWRKFRRRPKPLLGYSDLTALFGASASRSGAVCLYAPVVSELGDAGAYHRASLRKLLRGEAATMRFRRRQVLIEGRARGQLLGGNLTVLAHLWGTRYAPDLRGSILFLEDVGEQAYRLDRSLTQLRLAGAFRDLAGVALGYFSVPRRTAFPPDRPLEHIVEENFCSLGVPVVTGLRAGHVEGKWSLPLGGQAQLDTASCTLRLVP